MCGVRECSHFIILHIAVQFSQHHLLKRLPFLHCIVLPPLSGEGNGNPLQYSCLENPVDRGAWWAAIHGVTQSQTRLKWLSMHACIGEGHGNPLQCSCLKNPRDRGAWWAAIYGVAQSRTQLKRLSSSSLLCWRLGDRVWVGLSLGFLSNDP